MIALAIVGLILVSFITFLMVRVSISCMFWIITNPKDKVHVFRLYFPYYIIGLTALCVLFIIKFNFLELAICYFGGVYLLALLIWKYEIKKSITRKSNKNFAVEPNHPESP